MRVPPCVTKVNITDKNGKKTVVVFNHNRSEHKGNDSTLDDI